MKTLGYIRVSTPGQVDDGGGPIKYVLNERPRTKPREKRIRAFWAARLWKRKGFDSPEEFMEEGTCFACGFNTGTEEGPANLAGRLYRAHISPRCEGGADAAGNLHLLCYVCHKDSERLSGGKYWRWFLGRAIMDAFIGQGARCGVNVYSKGLHRVNPPPADPAACDLRGPLSTTRKAREAERLLSGPRGLL